MTTRTGEDNSRSQRAGQPEAGFESRPDLLKVNVDDASSACVKGADNMLTCDEIRSLCPKIPADVEQIYEMICEQWTDVVFTGSQAIGCATEKSDWDFVVSDHSEFWLPQHLTPDTTNAISCKGSKYITSVRIGKVNLIVDHRGDSILDNWRIATDYCQEHCVFDKQARIKVFDEMGAG